MNRKYYRGIWISKNIKGEWYWANKPPFISLKAAMRDIDEAYGWLQKSISK